MGGKGEVYLYLSLPIHLANAMLLLPQIITLGTPHTIKSTLAEMICPVRWGKKGSKRKQHILHFAFYLATFVIQRK